MNKAINGEEKRKLRKKKTVNFKKTVPETTQDTENLSVRHYTLFVIVKRVTSVL